MCRPNIVTLQLTEKQRTGGGQVRSKVVNQADGKTPAKSVKVTKSRRQHQAPPRSQLPSRRKHQLE